MPKKTKKAKLIAQYRRKLQQLEGTPVQQPVQDVKEPISTTYTNYVLPNNTIRQTIPTATLALPENEFLGIKKDLIRTVIVICLFFGIEVALWKLFG